MPASARKQQDEETAFDVMTLRKLVRLWDSDRKGERDTAFDKAGNLCKEHNPPLLFAEALTLAYGTNSEGMETLQAENDGLRNQLQQREADTAEIVNAYNEALERVTELEAQQGRRLDRQGGLWGLAVHAWRLPDFRLALLALILLTRFWLYAHYEGGGVGYKLAHEPVIANLLTALLGLFLFGKWNGLEYRERGFGQLLMKWLLFIGGLVPVVTLFFGDTPWITFRISGDVAHPVAATVLTIFVTLLAMSKFTRRLTYEITALLNSLFENPVLAAVKGWLI